MRGVRICAKVSVTVLSIAFWHWLVRGHMGADDATPLNRDMYQTAKDIDAVIEDLQQLMDKIYELARAAGQAPCVGIDFSIYFSARIHAMPVNRLYPLARSLCRDLSPDGCRNHSDLVEMLALRSEPLPDRGVEEEAAQTICDIISEMFMPFVEGGIACLLVCDPSRADLSPQAHAGALPPLHASLCYIVMFVVVWLPDSPKADEQAKRRAAADTRISAAAAFAARRTESTNPFETNGGVEHKHALASVVLRHGDRLRHRVVALLCTTEYNFAACTGLPEADPAFGHLTRAGIVQCAISLDTDMNVHLAGTSALLVNRFPRLVTALQPSAVSESVFPAVPNAFLWMFCLMGCDYTNGVQRFGYATSKKVLQAVSERVLKLEANINFGQLPVR